MSKQGKFAHSGRQSQQAQDDITVSTEQEVEKLVSQIGSVIRAADPQRRAGLKEHAETLLREEISPIPAQTEQDKESFAQRRVNPLAGGNFLNGYRCRLCFDCDACRPGSGIDRIGARHLGRNPELGEGIS